MAHLWSGRFEGSPDAALFEFGASFGFDRRLFEDDVTGSMAWADAIHARRRAVAAGSRRASRRRSRRFSPRGSDPAFFDSAAAKDDEDVHSFVERELVAAGRRRRTPPAHRTVAQRTGRARSAALSEAAGAAASAEDRGAARRCWSDQAVAAGDAVMPSYTHLRRAQPILVAHFFLAHAAALRRDHARFAFLLARDRRAAARLGRDRRHQLPDRRPRARRSARLLARRRQQHRRDRRARLRLVVPARRRADDGAHQPDGGGLHPLHVGGVPVLRARRHRGHRQQPDAAEEESRSAGAGARQVRPRHRPPRRMAGDDEEPADRLQQGSAGGQGSGVRGRGHAAADRSTRRRR